MNMGMFIVLVAAVLAGIGAVIACIEVQKKHCQACGALNHRMRIQPKKRKCHHCGHHLQFE